MIRQVKIPIEQQSLILRLISLNSYNNNNRPKSRNKFQKVKSLRLRELVASIKLFIKI
jgi:hypothetical protein